jgi:hypothetical protein
LNLTADPGATLEASAIGLPPEVFAPPEAQVFAPLEAPPEDSLELLLALPLDPPLAEPLPPDPPLPDSPPPQAASIEAPAAPTPRAVPSRMNLLREILSSTTLLSSRRIVQSYIRKRRGYGSLHPFARIVRIRRIWISWTLGEEPLL